MALIAPELMPQLLFHASRLSTIGINENDDPPVADETDDSETLRLTVLARKKKRSIVSFFNSTDVVTLPLKVHLYVQRFRKELEQWVFCGCREERKGTKVMCFMCQVCFCVRTPNTQCKSCCKK